jgi:hypothetical protein
LVLLPSDIIALLAADAKVLKQRLDTLVAAAKAAEEKAAAARRHVMAARQLLDKEQATAADLKWQTAVKKQVTGSTSSSTTETATTSLSYVDTIVTNFHIQVDIMMEEIHLNTSGPAAVPTAFYSNKTPPASLAPPHPLGKNNGSNPGNGNDSNNNQNRNNNRRNDGNCGKNNNTTMADIHEPVTEADRHVPWPGAHRPTATIGFHGHDGALHPTRLCSRAAAAVPAGPSCASSGLGTLEQRRLGPAVARELLQHHSTTAARQLGQ